MALESLGRQSEKSREEERERERGALFFHKGRKKAKGAK
jgi:hypothetical protein